MTPEKVKEAIKACDEAVLKKWPWSVPTRYLAKYALPIGPDHRSLVEHVRWMCVQANAFVEAGACSKAMRWLGFMQGALWSVGLLSIDDAREANKPDDEQFVPRLLANEEPVKAE